MQEMENMKDPEMKKKLMSDMLSNMKDLPPEAVSQFLSNLQDLAPSEQKELLKQILDKFDQLPSDVKEKLVDDLLKSAASQSSRVHSRVLMFFFFFFRFARGNAKANDQ